MRILRKRESKKYVNMKILHAPKNIEGVSIPAKDGKRAWDAAG